ncbi:restriction system protein [Methylomarinovum tepidoasis]|uniref:Restriction system protein n=2 Tax=Methylomarinovum tepidoasis TaxID=2840183 RepID=A0AAU9CD07_9GAMM|nr:restriction system protein [Methylomarinovum sp. IN45]
MPRKRTSFFEDLIDLVARLPWWAGVLFAVIGYLALHRLALQPVGTAATLEGTAGLVGRQMMVGFANLMQYLIPFAALFGAGISAFHRHQGKKLYRQLTESPSRSMLDRMSWRQFELLAGEAFRQQGYQIEERGSDGPDGGVDLVLHRDGKKYLVQCKHWKTRRVGVKPVRELFGVMAAEGADGGFVVASGQFTEDARRFVQNKPIELVDTEQLLALVNPQEPAGNVSDTEDNVPSCPICEAPMVERTARKGPRAGESFWGCSRFPKCRGTRPR